MKRKFTCAHCGKKNSFVPDAVRKQVSVQERVNCPSELVAYLPKCSFCGQTNSVPPPMPRKSKSTAGKARSANRHKAEEAPPVLPGHNAGKSADFWRSKSVEELAREQGVKPVENPEELKGDFWPEDESIDDFLAWLRARRHEGKEDS
jgi:hypothetical protein